MQLLTDVLCNVLVSSGIGDDTVVSSLKAIMAKVTMDILAIYKEVGFFG